jgi:hypothetical protein
MNEKPNWSDAPDWANWLAFNGIDGWTWFQDEPKLRGVNGYIKVTGMSIFHGTWLAQKESLEERPNDK